MRVLLVQPHCEEIYGRFKAVATEYCPLGLAYIAAVLERANHEVTVIDMPTENITEKGYIQIFEKFQPSVVGFSVLTPTSNYSHRLAKITKQISNEVRIVFGGVHPTVLPSEELKDPNVDFVVRGEGEYSTLNLINSLRNGGDLQQVLGISYKHNDRTVHNPAMPLIRNLDELPFPARHLLRGKYYYITAKRHPLDVVITSRGCPYRCIFCYGGAMGRMFRVRSLKNVVDEIESLVNDRGVREIHVIDDVFNLDLKRAKAICDEIINRKLDMIWALPNGIRANRKHIDVELVEKLHAAGCWLVAFGIESGDQDIINGAKKDLTLDEVRRAVQICRKVGIEELWGFFMLGLPGDNEKTIQRTIDFACELDLDVAKFHILVPYPGSEVYKMFNEQGLLKNVDWSKYGIHLAPVYDLPGLPEQKFLELHRRAYRSFYLRPRLLTKLFRKAMLSPRKGLNMLKTANSILRYAVLG